MAVSIIPFIPGDGNYRFSTTLNDEQYTFDVRWNSRDEAWYFDMLDAEGVMIVAGVKIVLGTYLGRRSAHPFFSSNVIAAIDTTLAEQDPTFDDLGVRVLVQHYPINDLIAELIT
jgi:hypothetical protein